MLHKKTFLKVSTTLCTPSNAYLTCKNTGFYQSLGCKRLSDLVQEEYQATEEVYGHERAQEVRSLILERLPLFLHEHTYVVPRVSFPWLNNEGNFIVRTFRKVEVTRSINFAGVKLSKSIEASAISRQKGRGEIQLWLACDMQVDMYEVATSLCRLLFGTHKVIDALFFMTMLSMDHHALQRRGYNGDNFFPFKKPYSLYFGSSPNSEATEHRERSSYRGPCEGEGHSTTYWIILQVT